MQLLNPIRRWLLRLKLHLLMLEVDDTTDDMADAKLALKWGTYAALAEFRAELKTEIDNTRRKLAALS